MNKHNKQRGFVLVASLMFLIIVTLIGVGMSGTTSNEEKVARNFRDRDIAFAAAEAAMRDAELHLTGAWRWPYTPLNINIFDSSCTAGLCDSMVTQSWQPVDNLDFYGSTSPGSSSVRIGSITGSPVVKGLPTADQPRYMIETVCTVLGSVTSATCNRVYRITAQARGRLSNTRVVLQEIYLSSDSVK
jgi:type IV pilus assembly protein PilX